MNEIKYKKASEIENFEDTNIIIHDEDFYMSEKQMGELFEASDKEVAKAIELMKRNGYCFSMNIIENNYSGSKIIYYRLDSVVAIGMNINSNKASRFQDWSYRQLINVLKNKSKESQRFREDNYNLCVINARLRKQLDWIN